ncbi:MAG: hypothetical protein AAFR83_24420 [Cyanobacteria bacterium J06629_18]
MNNTQLLFARLSISVAVVSSVFIIAIIIVPKLFMQTSEPSYYDYYYDYYAEDDNSTNFISVTCTEEFEDYCLNGGLCIYLSKKSKI